MPFTPATGPRLVAAHAGQRRALLDADVNYQVARDFTNRVKEQATGEKVLNAVSPGQQLVKIVYDELVYFLGETQQDITYAKTPPTVILVAGLQGSGKTTFCGKLANFFKGKGRAPMLVAADVYRPAAVDQLKKLAEGIRVPVHAVLDAEGKPVQDAVRVAKEAVAEARRTARDVVIIDTAGRLHVDEKMMPEVTDLQPAVSPHEIRVAVTMPRDIPRGTVVLRGGRVLTMRQHEIIENADVLIRDNRIVAVGPRDSVQVPADAHIIDVTGRTLIPGFVDTHYHAQWLVPEIHPGQAWQYLTNLSFGVTTTRDPQTASTDILSYADRVEVGQDLAAGRCAMGDRDWLERPVPAVEAGR